MSETSAALELCSVTRSFGATVANRAVSLAVAPGEFHALVGENGAGKSTAMRIAAGLTLPESGEVRIFGRRLDPHTPRRAIALGVGMVHQHFMLVDSLSVTENVVLGREPAGRPWLDLRQAAREIAALGDALGFRVDPNRRVADLGVGERQGVEILRVLWLGARLLILDEPTAGLAPAEARALLATLRRLCAEGRSVVLVTHRLDEVLAAADHITVLRRGEVVARFTAADTTAADIARAMMGGEPAPVAPRQAVAEGPPLLSLRDLESGLSRKVSLEIHGGEIVGVAGVEGNGQRDLLESIAGLRPVARGRVVLAGLDVTRASVRARRLAGLAFVPEDREHAVVPDFTLDENLRLGGVAAVADALAIGDVRPLDARARADTLSGGNQQKLILARELMRPFSVLVAAHPTRGIDLGSVSVVHDRLLAARRRGQAVLLVSADLDELRALCDRIAVLYRGEIVAMLPVADATDEALGAWMTGTHVA